MEIQNIQKDKNIGEDRSVPMSVRTSKEKSEYMKKQNISPTKFFNLSLDEMMKKYPIKAKKKQED